MREVGTRNCLDMEMVVSNLLVVEDDGEVGFEKERTTMKVYIRRWRNGERNYVMEGPYQIDAYNGLTFQTMEGGSGATTVVLGNTKVRTVFLHASEKDALVMYVEDATTKGGKDEYRREDATKVE